MYNYIKSMFDFDVEDDGTGERFILDKLSRKKVYWKLEKNYCSVKQNNKCLVSQGLCTT